MPSTWLNQFLVLIFPDLSAALDIDQQFSPTEMFSLLGSQDTYLTSCSLSGSIVGSLSLNVGGPGSQSFVLSSSLSMLTLLEISPRRMALETISTMMTPVLIYSAITRYRRLGGLKTEMYFLFLTVLEVESPR